MKKIKKLIMVLMLAIPFFVSSSVFAQNSVQNFQADLTVTYPSNINCPVSGLITGYVPGINYAYKEYVGEGFYVVKWNAGFPDYRPCTMKVKTVKDSQGNYCYGETTKNLSMQFNDITVELELISEEGGDEQ